MRPSFAKNISNYLMSNKDAIYKKIKKIKKAVSNKGINGIRDGTTGRGLGSPRSLKNMKNMGFLVFFTHLPPNITFNPKKIK